MPSRSAPSSESPINPTRITLESLITAEVAYIIALHSSLDKGPSDLVFVTFPGPIQPIKAFLRLSDRALQSLVLTLQRPNCSKSQHGQTGPAVFADP